MGFTCSFAQVKTLTKKDFLEKVYDFQTSPNTWKFKGKRPCVIDFYTTWCGPCKIMSPIMEEFSKKYNDKIDVYKVDIEQERDLAAAFGINSIPTFLFCPLKNQPQMAKGAMEKEQMELAIKDVLLK